MSFVKYRVKEVATDFGIAPKEVTEIIGKFMEKPKSYAAGTDQQCVRLACTKEEMGFVVGRTSLAIAAITDVQLALALVKSLGQPEKYKASLEVLEEKAAKAKKRQAEAKAHKRNVRMGKKK